MLIFSILNLPCSFMDYSLVFFCLILSKLLFSSLLLVQHQGRHFTLGLIRSSGFWIVGGKRAVNSAINNCIKCKKLRGRQQTQKIADLPIDDLLPHPHSATLALTSLDLGSSALDEQEEEWPTANVGLCSSLA